MNKISEYNHIYQHSIKIGEVYHLIEQVLEDFGVLLCYFDFSLR